MRMISPFEFVFERNYDEEMVIDVEYKNSIGRKYELDDVIRE